MAQISLPKSVTAGARSGAFLMPLGAVNQEVVIELVDEKPTDEMIAALERFWEKVFAELLPSEKGVCKAKRILQRNNSDHSITERQRCQSSEDLSSGNKRNMSSRITEKKFRIKEAAAIIGISPSGVRLLLNTKKLGYYQSGKRRIIGEGHLTDYLTKIERNKTKSRIY